MTIASSQWISEQKPFAAISAEGQKALEASAQLLRYRVGQPLCHAATVPSQVLVILQGSARLTVPEGDHWRTIERLGPGDVVGLASLLSAAPCEEVNASTELVAAAIPDSQVLDLLRLEPCFRTWCHAQVWTAELARLARILQERSPALRRHVRESLELLRSGAVVQAVEAAGPLPDADGLAWYAASANLPGLDLGQGLAAGDTLPVPSGPLAGRLIGLPVACVEELFSSPQQELPTIPADNGSVSRMRPRD